MTKLIIALTGASGANYSLDLLKALKKLKVETHVIVSDWAKKVMALETDFGAKEIESLATQVYDNKDLAAALASSSFLVDGMIIIPCTVKTASNIAHADCSDLITRAADNMLKTKKKLAICLRETPLSPPCLKNLYELSLSGAIVFPLSPGFYHQPKGLKDLSAFITGKLLDLFAIENKEFKRWE